MSVKGLEHYSKDQLIEELINRQTFAGIVVFHRGDAKSGQLESGEIVMTKSPPLTQAGVQHLLQLGSSLVPQMFSASPSPDAAFPIYFDLPALRVEEGGAVRVGTSRISLDLLVEQYENGMTLEEIVRAYDSLALAEVYSAIGYYLRHHDEVRSYLTRRQAEAAGLQQQIEAQNPRLSRDELIRRSAREKANAPAGQ